LKIPFKSIDVTAIALEFLYERFKTRPFIFKCYRMSHTMTYTKGMLFKSFEIENKHTGMSIRTISLIRWFWICMASK